MSLKNCVLEHPNFESKKILSKRTSDEEIGRTSNKRAALSDITHRPLQTFHHYSTTIHYHHIQQQQQSNITNIQTTNTKKDIGKGFSMDICDENRQPEIKLFMAPNNSNTNNNQSNHQNGKMIPNIDKTTVVNVTNSNNTNNNNINNNNNNNSNQNIPNTQNGNKLKTNQNTDQKLNQNVKQQQQPQSSPQQTQHQQQQQIFRIDPTDLQARMAHHIWGDQWDTIKHIDIDKDVHDDPVYCTEYINQVFDNMRISQIKTQPIDYMPHQTDLRPSMRALLVDWLVDIAFDLRVKNETIFLAVNYLDRYLSHVRISREQFQLIGASTFLLACKYEEINPPNPNEVKHLAGNYFTLEQLFEVESQILKTLGFSLTTPTIKFFLGRYLRAAGADTLVSALAHFFGELSLLDYNLVIYLPSIVSAACVYLALLTTNRQWTSTLTYYTRVDIDDPYFQHCVKIIWELHKSEKTLQTIKNKYSEHIRDVIPIPSLPF
eukprot:gene4232-5298_t